MRDPAASFEPFRDDSALRRIHREAIVLAAGGRALLMQIAHPSVARGVAEHSNYREDRLGRLLGTLRPMFAIAFGTREEALDAAARVNALHAHVRGEGYAATDPDLLLWVHATLVDSALVAHRRFLGPIERAEAERYYGEMAEVARLLGLPRSALPPDLVAFERYVDSMAATLEVTPEARAIAADLFRATPFLGLPMLLVREVTAGLLPPRLRHGYGLSWDPARAATLEAAAALSRAVLPHLPLAVRRTPDFLLPPSARRGRFRIRAVRRFR